MYQEPITQPYFMAITSRFYASISRLTALILYTLIPHVIRKLDIFKSANIADQVNEKSKKYA